LQYLADLTKLEELDLGARVTDRGLPHLKNRTAMRQLNLLGAPVTDQSADVLAAITGLRELNLYNCDRVSRTAGSSKDPGKAPI